MGKPMVSVKYTEGKVEYTDGIPKWVENEWDAMLEGVQGDGSAIIYINTIPYRVSARHLKRLDGSPVIK